MAKPLLWYLNAPRRTLRALLPELAPPDDAFARASLPSAEYRLYLSMDRRDRQHACDVAKALRARHPGASDELVRAALLHDVGKAGRPYRLLERIVVHLLPSPWYPVEPRLEGLAGALQMKRHHPVYGAAMIRAAGGGERVARLVAHDPSEADEVALLERIDDET